MKKNINNLVAIAITACLTLACNNETAALDAQCGSNSDNKHSLTETVIGTKFSVKSYYSASNGQHCITIERGDQNTIIDTIVAEGTKINLMLIEKIQNHPMLLLLVPKGDSIENLFEVSLYDLKLIRKIFSGESSQKPLLTDIDNDKATELVLFQNNIGLTSAAQIDLGWPVIIKLTDQLSLGNVKDYPGLIMKLISQSEIWLNKLSDICNVEGTVDESCSALDDVRKIKVQMEYMRKVLNEV